MTTQEQTAVRGDAGQAPPRRVILIGPPGAGKGTQAHLIQSQLGIPHISTGDLFRRNIDNDSHLGKRAQEYILRGELVPDELTMEMVSDRLAEHDARVGFLLDGFPRNLGQACFLAEVLGRAETSVDAVLHLRADQEEIVRRLQGRRTCQRCGQVWHVEFNPTLRQRVCDTCGGALLHREDDQEQAIRRRLEIHESQTSALIAFYRQQRVLVSIDASGPVSGVHARTLEALGC